MKTLLHKGILFLCSILVFSSCSKDSATSTEDISIEEANYQYSTFEMDVLNEVNKVREDNGLSTLELIDVASFQALEHNKHMLEMDEICHHNFEDRKNAILRSTNATGVGENIAHGTATAKSVVQAWLDSEGHKKNVLHEAYTHFGIAISQESEDVHYYTNIFVIM